jgi:hypothetical protein
MLKALENAAWIAAFAFVVAFVVGMGMSPSQPQPSQNQTQGEHQPQANDSNTQPDINESANQKSGNWSEYKKQVQQYWNSFIGFLISNDKLVFSFGIIVIVIFTGLLGISTLFLYTSTRDLVNGAAETAERQLRAYVFVKEAFVRNLEGPDPPTIHVYLKNFGQTPAYKLTNAGAVKFTTFPNLDFSRDPKGDQRLTVMTIPPSGESATAVDLPFVVTPEIKERLKTGKDAIYAFGRIEYDDTFKKHRIANYRFIFGGDAGTRLFEREGVRLGAMAQTIEGNTTEGE